MHLRFDVSVVVECGVQAEYCLDLALRFVTVDRSPWVVVEENATRRRNEGATGERRVVKPGAMQIVLRSVNTATVQLPNNHQYAHF